VISGIVVLATMAFIAAMVFRLMDRRDHGDPRRLERLEERIARLEGSVESMASEMERLGEGQRFMTKLLADRGGGSGASRVDDPERPS
jgi:hypothetical protein